MPHKSSHVNADIEVELESADESVNFVTQLATIVKTMSGEAETSRIAFCVDFIKKLVPFSQIRDYHEKCLQPLHRVRQQTEYLRQITGKTNNQNLTMVHWAQGVSNELIVKGQAQPSIQELHDKAAHQLKTIETQQSQYARSHLNIIGYDIKLCHAQQEAGLVPEKNVLHIIKSKCIDKTLYIKLKMPNGLVKSVEMKIEIANTKFYRAYQALLNNDSVEELKLILPEIQQCLSQDGYMQFATSIWSDSDYTDLIRDLTNGAIAQFKTKAAIQFLQNISTHLLHIITSETSDEEIESFNSAVTTVLKQHAQGGNNGVLLLNISRMYLALGASIIPWVDAWKDFIRPASTTLYLVVEQAVMIVSHLEFRAQYLGDTYTHLGKELNDVITRTKAFAQNLFGVSVVDDTGGFKRFLLHFIPTTAETERALIFVGLIRWIDSLLNKVFPNGELEIDPYLQKIMDEYILKVGTGNFLVNDGHSYFVHLQEALEPLMRRFTVCNALRRERAAALYLEREIKTSLQENMQSMLFDYEDDTNTMTPKKLNNVQIKKRLENVVRTRTNVHKTPEAWTRQVIKKILFEVDIFLPFRAVDLANWDSPAEAGAEVQPEPRVYTPLFRVPDPQARQDGFAEAPAFQ